MQLHSKYVVTYGLVTVKQNQTRPHPWPNQTSCTYPNPISSNIKFPQYDEKVGYNKPNNLTYSPSRGRRPGTPEPMPPGVGGFVPTGEKTSWKCHLPHVLNLFNGGDSLENNPLNIMVCDLQKKKKNTSCHRHRTFITSAERPALTPTASLEAAHAQKVVSSGINLFRITFTL